MKRPIWFATAAQKAYDEAITRARQAYRETGDTVAFREALDVAKRERDEVFFGGSGK